MKTPRNRMADELTRTPPPADSPPVLPTCAAPAEVIEFPRAPLVGIRCPACGRGMVPRRYATEGPKTYAACTLCPARLCLTFDADGRPAHVRVVSSKPPLGSE